MGMWHSGDGTWTDQFSHLSLLLNKLFYTFAIIQLYAIEWISRIHMFRWSMVALSHTVIDQQRHGSNHTLMNGFFTHRHMYALARAWRRKPYLTAQQKSKLVLCRVVKYIDQLLPLASSCASIQTDKRKMIVPAQVCVNIRRMLPACSNNTRLSKHIIFHKYRVCSWYVLERHRCVYICIYLCTYYGDACVWRHGAVYPTKGWRTLVLKCNKNNYDWLLQMMYHVNLLSNMLKISRAGSWRARITHEGLRTGVVYIVIYTLCFWGDRCPRQLTCKYPGKCPESACSSRLAQHAPSFRGTLYVCMHVCVCI
jgi:hypothetical protein